MEDASSKDGTNGLSADILFLMHKHQRIQGQGKRYKLSMTRVSMMVIHNDAIVIL